MTSTMLVPSYLGAHSAHPAPAEVCDQLDQPPHLEQVAGHGAQEGGVDTLVRQTGTGGKVTHLETAATEKDSVTHLADRPR